MRRRKKKKLNKKKLLLSISILAILPFASINLSKLAIEAYSSGTNSTGGPISISENDAKYGIIKEDTNKNYPGKGQEDVKDKDGYFTTFTTTNNKKYIEYKQNLESSWNNNLYWDDTMATSRMRNYSNFYYFKWIWQKLHTRRFKAKILSCIKW